MLKTSTDKIEILSVDLLDQQRPLVEALKRLAGSLGLEFGWHYLLDLTWIISQLGDIQGQAILDAGAGTGILQWYLAGQGADVLSVDRLDRSRLALRFRSRFNVRGLHSQDLQPAGQVLRSAFAGQGGLKAGLREAASIPGAAISPKTGGCVTFYHQDLKTLVDVPDNSLDAVVAVSALEHNTPEGLQQVVAELMRVLKPGGILAASLCAARDQDTWHAPSSGWCYTAASLRRLFGLSSATPSNYDQFDLLFNALKNCSELRENLARFYFRSGDNGMPWGLWYPQYQPVGVCKLKPVKGS